jgi:DNA polymerase III subunit epsilon
MSWWERLRKPASAPAQSSGAPERWVVVDVETTGLDLRHDRLLAIAAIGLQTRGDAAPRIVAADVFDAVLQRSDARADKDNILLHGIGVQQQRQGAPAPEVMAAFEAWLGDAPLIGFHTLFDVTMLSRALKDHRGHWLTRPWLDLEPLAAMVYGEGAPQTLDHWLARFGITCLERHRASADAFATAELLQALWPRLKRQRCTQFRAMQKFSQHRRWLPG